MNESKSIMIVGVGGQGSLLASKLIGNVLMKKGFDVKLSEVHGMAQRGGSVVTYVKYGDKVFSPTIEQGEADLILSFEMLEGARWLPYLKKTGKMILNLQRIDPMPVITGSQSYPENLPEKLRKQIKDFISIDALSLAKESGNSKTVNVVMMGVLAANLDLDQNLWEQAIEECVPEKFIDMNKKAFRSGYNSKGV